MKRYIAFLWSQHDAAGGWGDKVEGSYDSIEDAIKAVKADKYYNQAYSVWEVIDLNDLGRVVAADS